MLIHGVEGSSAVENLLHQVEPRYESGSVRQICLVIIIDYFLQSISSYYLIQLSRPSSLNLLYVVTAKQRRTFGFF